MLILHLYSGAQCPSLQRTDLETPPSPTRNPRGPLTAPPLHSHDRCSWQPGGPRLTPFPHHRNGSRKGYIRGRGRSAQASRTGPRPPPPHEGNALCGCFFSSIFCLFLSEKRPHCRRGNLTPEGNPQRPRRRARLHSQREPILHSVDPMEAAPVQASIHRVVVDPGQRLQGAGSERRGRVPDKDGGTQSGRGEPSGGPPRGPLPGCSPPSMAQPPGRTGHPSRREAGHSLPHRVHQVLVFPVGRVEGRAVDKELRLHDTGAPLSRSPPQVSWHPGRLTSEPKTLGRPKGPGSPSSADLRMHTPGPAPRMGVRG